jgi:hypothetical protein
VSFRHNRASNAYIGNEILQNKITGTQTSFSTNFGGKLSFIPSFVSASTAATYIFTAPTCRTTIITLEPCALNAEFQHFMLGFNKISLLCGYLWSERGDSGWKQRGKGVKERVILWITLISSMANWRIEPHNHFDQGGLVMNPNNLHCLFSP